MYFKLQSGESVDLHISEYGEGYALVDENGKCYASLDRDSDDKASFVSREAESIFAEPLIAVKGKLDRLAFIYLMQEFSGVESESDFESDEDSSAWLRREPEDIYDDEENPFNPDKISIDSKPMTMDRVLTRIEQGTITLSPDFQRSVVWDDERKSRLIESLLLRIPIPMFYVSSDAQGNLTVVDGLQRISTFRDFILGEEYLKDPEKNRDKKGDGFHLVGLEFWTDYENKTMNDLPLYLKNRLMETEFRFTIINPGTPEVVRRNIFRRINTGGMPLSSQEIRNALYGGRATKLLNRLVALPEFTKATGTIRSERMEDKELALRLISFFIRKPEKFSRSTSTDNWLSDTMIILNAMPDFYTKEFKKLQERHKGMDVISLITILLDDDIVEKFQKAMIRAQKLFGASAFRKSLPGRRRSPINKALFEVWGVLLAGISETKFQSLLANKNRFFEDYGKLLAQPEFVVAISRDSMRYNSVKDRYMKLTNLIDTYSHD